MTPLRLAAPAKLNLSLRVIGRRDDGYHELDGVTVLLDLADRLLLLPGCSGLRVADPDGRPVPGVPVQPDENLAWRGLRAGLGESARSALACLTLEKRIPAAAGLGGGSSDAAAGWRLGRRWSGRPEVADADTLRELARIGADVPLFAAATGAARVRGIGERVEPLPTPPPSEVVLVHSPRGLSTAAAFGALRPADRSADVATDVPTAMDEGRNDLLPVARRLVPEIDELLRLVAAAGGRAQMSGSGPTVFTIGNDAEHADRIAAQVARAGVRVTRTRVRPAAATIEAIDEEEA